MSTPSQQRLSDIATRHQVFLERLKTGRAVAFAVQFKEVEKITLQILNKLEGPISELTRKKLTAMLSELSTANGEVMGRAIIQMFGDLEKLSNYETGFEQRSLKSVLSPKVNVLQPTAHAAYTEALAQPMSATGDLLAVFVDTWSGGELRRMNNVVQRAWGEGWNLQQLTQAIRGTKAQGFKDGILETSRRNAEIVARTSIQHVASMSRMATWESNKDIVRGYIYIATLDARTTQICRSLDQRHFKMGAGPVPPVHMGCRSTTIAELDPALDFLDQGATRSSLNGEVPADMSYYEWLKTQPAEFQNEAIGKSRGQLFRDGGLSADKFAELNLGRNFQPLTLDEMRKLEPLAFKRAGLN